MNFMEALKRSSVASNGREMTKKIEVKKSLCLKMSQGCKVYSHGMMLSLGCRLVLNMSGRQVQTLKVRLHLLVATPADQIAPSTTATS